MIRTLNFFVSVQKSLTPEVLPTTSIRSLRSLIQTEVQYSWSLMNNLDFSDLFFGGTLAPLTIVIILLISQWNILKNIYRKEIKCKEYPRLCQNVLYEDIYDLYENIYVKESFGPGGLGAPCVLACAMRSLAIVITIVQSFFLSLSVFCFWTTSGNLPCVKICFPKYFGINRR